MSVPTVYRHDDASAPVLDGTVSSLIDLLDACLVTGYGAKSAAGWTKPYTGTNKAVFRNSAVSGTGYHFRLLDDGVLSSNAGRDCEIRGYQTMSDVDTGSFPAPTVAQLANGRIWRKSGTADATAREWVVIADERTAIVVIWPHGTSLPPRGEIMGDFDPVDGDTVYHVVLSGQEASAGTTASRYAVSNSRHGIAAGGLLANAGVAPTTSAGGQWSIGSRSALDGAADTAAGPICSTNVLNPPGAGNGSTIWGLMGPSPQPLTLQDYWTRVAVFDSTGVLRGYLRGVYFPLTSVTLNASPLGDGDSLDLGLGGSSDLLYFRHYSGQTTTLVNTQLGAFAVEIGESW
jgi:hypothetical protein